MPASTRLFVQSPDSGLEVRRALAAVTLGPAPPPCCCCWGRCTIDDTTGVGSSRLLAASFRALTNRQTTKARMKAPMAPTTMPTMAPVERPLVPLPDEEEEEDEEDELPPLTKDEIEAELAGCVEDDPVVDTAASVAIEVDEATRAVVEEKEDAARDDVDDANDEDVEEAAAAVVVDEAPARLVVVPAAAEDEATATEDDDLTTAAEDDDVAADGRAAMTTGETGSRCPPYWTADYRPSAVLFVAFGGPFRRARGGCNDSGRRRSSTAPGDFRRREDASCPVPQISPAAIAP